jgi:hypothetical protein
MCELLSEMPGIVSYAAAIPTAVAKVESNKYRNIRKYQDYYFLG